MNFEKGNCRFGKMNFEVCTIGETPIFTRQLGTHKHLSIFLSSSRFSLTFFVPTSRTIVRLCPGVRIKSTTFYDEHPAFCNDCSSISLTVSRSLLLFSVDFSWGFPDPWMLQFTDIVVPSNHAFEGKIYDAEVVLSHVYSVNQHDRLIGNVAVLLEAGDEDDHYDFLELYIRRWIEELKVVEENCNSTRRMMRGDASAMDEDFDEADDHGTIRSLKKRRLEEPEKPIQYLEKKHYEGEFHPYDW